MVSAGVGCFRRLAAGVAPGLVCHAHDELGGLLLITLLRTEPDEGSGQGAAFWENCSTANSRPIWAGVQRLRDHALVWAKCSTVWERATRRGGQLRFWP